MVSELNSVSSYLEFCSEDGGVTGALVASGLAAGTGLTLELVELGTGGGFRVGSGGGEVTLGGGEVTLGGRDASLVAAIDCVG
jgi:hypothetical protein